MEIASRLLLILLLLLSPLAPALQDVVSGHGAAMDRAMAQCDGCCDRDCCQAGDCLGGCGVLSMLPSVAPAHAPGMVAGSAVVFVPAGRPRHRHDTPFRPPRS